MKATAEGHLVEVSAGPVVLEGDLEIPEGAKGIVLFAHGSGSSRFSPRNRFVAGVLRKAGLGTLLVDLLTPGEEKIDAQTAQLRFDIPRLAERLIGITDWLVRRPETLELRIGYFGASTGAAAALIAASKRRDAVGAIVSRGGRPDLAGSDLALVEAPTLLIVGGHDSQVLELNRVALEMLTCEKELVVVPGATHLFEEPGALEEVAQIAADWFTSHVRA